MKNFKLGEPVLFCDGWGMAMKSDKIYRWGAVRAGFITMIEYVSARNSLLYSVGTVDQYDQTKVHTRLLGEHLVFKIDEKSLAEEAVKQYCEEV
jgi:hypothetical protein